MPSDDHGHELEIRSEGVPAEVVAIFSNTVRFAHQAITSVSQFGEVPLTKVDVLITSDFVASVQRVLDNNGHGGDPYKTERLGGAAVAKAIRTSDDYSAHTVVFDAAQWQVGANSLSPFGVVLAAHEMSHVMLGRSRWASGALEGVVIPSVTPVEAARSMVRTAVEELRADILAGSVLALVASTTLDGETRPSRPGDLIGHDCYRKQLAEVLTGNVYPGWPDAVQHYRTHQMTLDRMWQHIGQSTDQVLTLLAHCQAEVHFAEKSTDVFDQSLGQHRGAQLYLQPTWDPIIEVLESQGVIPDFADTRAAELELLEVAEEAVLALWGRLGLTVEVMEEGRYSIWVSEPGR